MENKIYLSYSGMSCFMDCKRMYYWRYIQQLELIQFSPHFIIGNAIDFGISLLYEKDANTIKKTLMEFSKLRKKLRGEISLNIQQEQELNDQEVIIVGMLEAYKDIHKKHIKELRHQHTQLKANVDFNGITVGIKIDNIIGKKKKLYLHELKTTKQLTPDYVKNIKNDLQTAIYFHIYNLKKLGPTLDGIIYDVIQKPSIRLKKKETKQEFVGRLKEYYKGPDGNTRYYMEIIDQPLLHKDRILNTITGIADDLKNRKTMEDFYPNDRFCYVYKRCEYYTICHEGATKSILANYKKRGGEKNDNKKENKA